MNIEVAVPIGWVNLREESPKCFRAVYRMEDNVNGTVTGKTNQKLFFMAGSGTGKRRELKGGSGQQTSPVDLA